MKKITIGMLASVDSGKTTLSEAMLYETGTIRKAGRVDHGDSFFDTDKIERERGITIFSKQARIEWGNVCATILDTPGHVDFAAEMERTLSVIDYAILIIGANDGIKAHTDTLWKLLAKHGVPVFVFVNKMDLVDEGRAQVIERLKKGLDERLVDFSETDSTGFNDDISMISDKAAEMMLSDMDDRELREALDLEIIRLIENREAFPVYFGSALRMQGVRELLDGLARFTHGFMAESKGEASGKIFKVSYDGDDRITFIKITSGRLKPRNMLRVNPRDGETYEEKVNEIRIYSGEKYTVSEAAEPGDVVAVTGLTKTAPGDVFGNVFPDEEEVIQPYMSYNVHAKDTERTHDLIAALSVLAKEDPKLEAEWISGTDDIIVRIMGTVQLEVLERVIKDRFGIECFFDEERIIYRETVRGVYEGVGHFEPLRHYSEVHLIVSPAERGTGISIRSECPLESLDINWQNLVMSVLGRHHLRGTLIGASLTDVDICLVEGRASKKHTEGGDFREAALRALRQALMQARDAGDMVLLEPWLDIRIETEVPEIGAIMTDIDNMGGRLDPPDISDDGVTAVLTGCAPAAGLRGYAARLAGSAHGRTTFSCAMGGYDICTDPDDVIAQHAYDPERDVRNTADSVFCSHGSGDIVKWNEVFSHMHIPSVLEARKKKENAEQGIYDDDAFDNEAFIAERKRKYKERIATDKELKAIFEKTYGPIKHFRREREKEDDFDSYDYYESGDSRGSSGTAGGSNGRTGTAGGSDGAAGTAVREIKQETVTTHLFVDGYNLIHAWPELKELADVDFGSARDELTDIVCNYAGFMGYDTILVYDAYKVNEGVGSRLSVHGITVVYTREHETADAYIERETLNLMKRIKNRSGKSQDKDRIIVVTSDNLEQIVSMGHGALRISSREFIEEIGRVEELIRGI